MSNLSAWDIRVVLDLFLGGIGVGAFLLSVMASFYHQQSHKLIVRVGALLAPVAVGLGLLALITKLGRPEKFIETLWLVNPQSVMSIGVFLQTGFMIFACIYAIMVMATDPNINVRFRTIQAIGAFFAISVGLYHGLFLSSLGRVLWTEMVPGMFLASSLATGVAAVLLIQSLWREPLSSQTRSFSYPILLLVLLMFQLVSVVLWQFYTGRLELEQAISYQNFMDNYGILWTWAILIGGILLPGLIALNYLIKGISQIPRITAIVVSVLILAGGYMMKHLMVMGGQVAVPVSQLF